MSILSKNFNEDTRVKIPATIHFLRLGYEYQSLNEDNIDFNTKIFFNRFKKSIEKINNKEFSVDEIIQIIKVINQMINNNDLGKEFYNWLINPMEKIKLIDFDNIYNNNFAVVNELAFTIDPNTNKGSFRPDINILINGIPLGFLEVKRPNNPGGIQVEFNRLINERLPNEKFKKFFNLIQIIAVSNNMNYEKDIDFENVKAGSFYTTPNGKKTSFSFFREEDFQYILNYHYKNINDTTIRSILIDCGYNKSELNTLEFKENLKKDTPCNQFITSLFTKKRLMYFLQYGTMYLNGTEKEKHIMRYPQFFATNNIIKRLNTENKNGIIWHTQGSGKTALVAFSIKIIADFYSKKNVNTKFFFVVDRLDLLNQASYEFKKRGFNVINLNSKNEFIKELNKSLSTTKGSKDIGEICVVNIQKFQNDIPKAKNYYNVNLQRIFFIDEAHRSYSLKGEYFKNLMTCDNNAIYIALTGTPLLSSKERSNLKFGDYIHTYFYDKSIADGYTLKIKKENIDTNTKNKIKTNLNIKTNINNKLIYESNNYINSLSKFIDSDFKKFRNQFNDNSLGSIIVCRSNLQAKKIYDWFRKNSRFNVGLVISDNNSNQSKINKKNQNEFRNYTSLDILIVHYMLTTGYDVNRLKKLYLLRKPHEHSLLQTISRVNRPYKSKTQRYKYGYIVDFVDITNEYDNTISSYIKELEKDYNKSDVNYSLDGLVIDKEEINKKYQESLNKLHSIINTNNKERFRKELELRTKEEINQIKELLNEIRGYHNELILSKAENISEKEVIKIKDLSNLTKDRLNFINLTTDTVNILNDQNIDVNEILYNFIKTKEAILNITSFNDNINIKKFKKLFYEIQKEIRKNKNINDPEIIEIEIKIQKILNLFNQSDFSNLYNLNKKLKEILNELHKINKRNDKLAHEYGDNFAFVKTYQNVINNYKDIEKSKIKKMLKIIFDYLNSNKNKEILLTYEKENFINIIKKNITKELLNKKIYSTIKKYYNQILEELYNNLKKY